MGLSRGFMLTYGSGVTLLEQMGTKTIEKRGEREGNKKETG